MLVGRGIEASLFVAVSLVRDQGTSHLKPYLVIKVL